jgi:secreted PhoX family phosphatase
MPSKLPSPLPLPSTLTPSVHPDNDRPLGASAAPGILDVIASSLSRRVWLQSSWSAAALALVAAPGFARSQTTGSEAAAGGEVVSGLLGFQAVPPNLATSYIDRIAVPTGYNARVLLAWGDAIGVTGPTAGRHWDASGPMTEAVQLGTWGSHNDGMHYFPMPARRGRAGKQQRGLLVANHEYIDAGLLNDSLTPGQDKLDADRVAAQIAAHGVSVVALAVDGGRVQVQRPSPQARRITGATPCRLSGPAAGHGLLRTQADPTGRRVLGTLNNCAHGFTPWGTYLTCEENFNTCFGTSAEALVKAPLTEHEKRYGLKAQSPYRWHEVEPRFDLRAEPQEPNRFGWVVEIDPFDPRSTPIKRTALGRFKHESATHALGADGRVAIYMGDDERNDYVYKFVCARPWRPKRPEVNRHLLDEGTLYVARFDADGSGTWLPLVWGQGGLTPEKGFADQGEVLIKARQAADHLGATPMDRPEWMAVHPSTREVYVTLTSNDARGKQPAGKAQPPVDAANPRADNRYGHILRWREDKGDVAATRFQWDIFMQCGDKQHADPARRGNIRGDDLGAPDGLWFDPRGRLWIQTDQPGDGTGDWASIGGNLMACADPVTREVRRFLTAPRRCEVTGVTMTPDGRTMFVGIQHPGEGWKSSHTEVSTWPDSGANGPTTQTKVAKPRSAVVVITKDDGGVIGT